MREEILAEILAMLERLAGRTSFWVLGVVAVGLLLTVNFADFSWTLAGFRHVSGGVGILDMQWHYDAATAYHLLEAQGERGRAAYLHLFWTVDLAIPFSVSLWLAVAIILGARYRAGVARGRDEGGDEYGNWNRYRRWRKLAWLALLAGAMDLCENSLVSVLLLSYPVHHDMLAGLAGYVTSAKHLLYLSAALCAVALPLSRLLTRRREGHAP